VTAHELDRLVDDLTHLGHDLPVPPPSPTLATEVLARVAALPVPAPSRTRWFGDLADRAVRWRRGIAVAVVALLVALLATPPVRAAVADWFGFAGVIVQRGSVDEDDAPPPPRVDDGGMTVAQAADLVGFTPLVPTDLGEPEAVEVSPDRVFVSMSWDTEAGPVRLDQFDGRLDFRIAKTSPGVQYASVAGVDALWFEEPHEVVILDEQDQPRTETARLAGHTLIWPLDDLTLRLEGDLSLERALEIGASATPYAS
jgi:hypothetical protein